MYNKHNTSSNELLNSTNSFNTEVEYIFLLITIWKMNMKKYTTWLFDTNKSKGAELLLLFYISHSHETSVEHHTPKKLYQGVFCGFYSTKSRGLAPDD